MWNPFALAVRCIALVGLSFSKGSGKNARCEIMFSFYISVVARDVFKKEFPSFGRRDGGR